MTATEQEALAAVRLEESPATGVQMTTEDVERFLDALSGKGRSAGTVVSYRNALTQLYQALPENKRIHAGTMRLWRDQLVESGYSQASVNRMMSACNQFVGFLGYRAYQVPDRLDVKTGPQPELSRNEYLRLLAAAKSLGDEKLYLLIKVFACTGLYAQSLPFVTVENVRAGRFLVDCQGVRATIRVPECLQKELLAYGERRGIQSGPLFLSRDDRPIHRSVVTDRITRLCAAAQVEEKKGNPRCLRKLYLSTRANIERNFELLIEQAMDRQLEQEQLTTGWQT